MSHSSASAVVFLPFGSLTGLVPIDSVQRTRVLGDFSTIIGADRHLAMSHAIPVTAGSDPACSAWPPSLPPSGDGGI